MGIVCIIIFHLLAKNLLCLWNTGQAIEQNTKKKSFYCKIKHAIISIV